MSRDDFDLGVYLAPAEFVDSDAAIVRREAARLRAGRTPSEALVAMFRFVRDLLYQAPQFDRLDSFKASDLLQRGRGYCVPKACALTALARAAGIPARLGFADVSNHLATGRTLELMGTRTFAWHGFTEAWVHERWIKLSPTFDEALCIRMGVPPLEFDGLHDAYLPACDGAGRNFMSYDRHHGSFHDVPARYLSVEMPRRYPGIWAAIQRGEVE